MGESNNFEKVSKTEPQRWVKRPLVTVVIALMLGLAGAAWGFQVSGVWMIALLIGLIAILILLYCSGSFRSSQDKPEGQQ